MFFFKQKTAYEMRISDWSSDVCSSDLKSAFPDSFVMSTGGGAPCFFNNMDWMNRTGITMYLRAHPGEIARRLENQREERRSEARRLGQECVSTCNSRWSRLH